MIRRFTLFYDSLNIAFVLYPGFEFFGVKCVQFPHNKFQKSFKQCTTVGFAHVSCDFFSLYLIMFTFTMRSKNSNYKSH